jgi:hypothetical protein
MAAALRAASVIVTATGFDGVLGERQLSQVAGGAILVNVGHSDREIDVDWLDCHPSTPIRRHLERYELDGRRVYLLNRGSMVNLAAGLGIGAAQLFDPFAAIVLLGLDAILSGQTANLPNGVQRYPHPLEARVVRALPPAPPDRCSGLAGWTARSGCRSRPGWRHTCCSTRWSGATCPRDALRGGRNDTRTGGGKREPSTASPWIDPSTDP